MLDRQRVVWVCWEISYRQALVKEDNRFRGFSDAEIDSLPRAIDPDRVNPPDSYDEANTILRIEHAHRIREVMCVVQRICEENRPFYPNADFSAPVLFNRSFKVKDWYTDEVVVLFNAPGCAFHGDFGSNSHSGFSIFKDRVVVCGPALGGDLHGVRLSLDLIAVHRRMEDANNNVDEFKPNLILSRGPTL